MRKMRRIALIALAIMLCCTAMAASFDLNRTGSITVVIHTAADVRVENAKIELYRVGEPVIVDSNLTFELTDAFAESGVSLNDLSAAGLADALAAVEAEPVETKVTSANGVVTFSNLTPGLYLVKQNGFSKKMYFTQTAPFIVSLPMTNAEGTGWVYEIEASPKVGELPKPTATPTATGSPTDEKLPQTGMLRWPIPVLGVGGLLMFSLGWALCFMKKKNDRDA